LEGDFIPSTLDVQWNQLTAAALEVRFKVIVTNNIKSIFCERRTSSFNRMDRTCFSSETLGLLHESWGKIYGRQELKFMTHLSLAISKQQDDFATILKRIGSLRKQYLKKGKVTTKKTVKEEEEGEEGSSDTSDPTDLSGLRARAMTLEGAGLKVEPNAFIQQVVENMSWIRFVAWDLMKYWVLALALTDSIPDNIYDEATVDSVIRFVYQTAKQGALSTKTLSGNGAGKIETFKSLVDLVKTPEMKPFMDTITCRAGTSGMDSLGSQIDAVATQISTSFSNFYLEQGTGVMVHFMKATFRENLKSNKDFKCAVSRLGLTFSEHQENLLNAYVKQLERERKQTGHLMVNAKEHYSQSISDGEDATTVVGKAALMLKLRDKLIKHSNDLNTKLKKVGDIIRSKDSKEITDFREKNADVLEAALRRTYPFDGELIPEKDVIKILKNHFSGHLKTSPLHLDKMFPNLTAAWAKSGEGGNPFVFVEAKLKDMRKIASFPKDSTPSSLVRWRLYVIKEIASQNVDGEGKKFDLTPSPSYKRIFVSIGKQNLHHLLPEAELRELVKRKGVCPTQIRPFSRLTKPVQEMFDGPSSSPSASSAAVGNGSSSSSSSSASSPSPMDTGESESSQSPSVVAAASSSSSPASVVASGSGASSSSSSTSSSPPPYLLPKNVKIIELKNSIMRKVKNRYPDLGNDELIPPSYTVEWTDLANPFIYQRCSARNLSFDGSLDECIQRLANVSSSIGASSSSSTVWKPVHEMFDELPSSSSASSAAAGNGASSSSPSTTSSPSPMDTGESESSQLPSVVAAASSSSSSTSIGASESGSSSSPSSTSSSPSPSVAEEGCIRCLANVSSSICLGNDALLLVFDFETNGLNVTSDFAVQIACKAYDKNLEVLLNESNEPREFTSNVKIDTPLDIAACKVNNYDVDLNNGAQPWSVVGKHFAKFLRDLQVAYPNIPLILIGHDSKRFDARVLYEENKANNIVLPNGIHVVDSIEVAKAILSEESFISEKRSFTLGDLYQKLVGVVMPNAHDAMGDVVGLHKVLHKLKESRSEETCKLTSLSCILNDKSAISLNDLFAKYDAATTASETTARWSLCKFLDLNDVMFYLFDEKKVKHLLSELRRGCFGRSFVTNGVSVSFLVESIASRQEGDRKVRSQQMGRIINPIRARAEEMLQEEGGWTDRPEKRKGKNTKSSDGAKRSRQSFAATNRKEPVVADDGADTTADDGSSPAAEETELDRFFVKGMNEIKTTDSEAETIRQLQSLPDDATIVSCDFGIHNTAVTARGCKRSSKAGSLKFEGVNQEDRSTLQYLTDKSLTNIISSSSITNASGAPFRLWQQKCDKEEYVKTHAAFARAEIVVAENSPKTVDLAELLKSITARAQTYDVLFKFYGSERYARDKLSNRVGVDEAIDRVARVILPKPTDVLVGGIDFAPIQHCSNSISYCNKLITRVRKTHLFIKMGEHRTSILHCESRQYMHHPVGQEKKKTILEREKREKFREERKRKKDEKGKQIEAESNNGVDGGSSSGSEMSSSSSTSGSKKVGGDGGASATIDMEDGEGMDGGDRMEKEGGGGHVSRGKVKRISGLYQVSSDNGTHLKNRDINAAVNMLQIIYSLRDFGEIPWEFRKDVILRKFAGYNQSREYDYTAKRTNSHGQIIKFSRVLKVDDDWKQI
jgi:DNA polymerase III epsilon subunit-like protein